MNVMLDNYTLPETGWVAFNVYVAFEIRVTAEQARRKVDTWLLNEVSYLMGAEPPTLVLGQRPVWRVPARISFPSTGPAGIVGTIDVDVETGETYGNTPERKAEMERCGEAIAVKLPPFQVKELPPDYITNLNPPPKVFPR